MNLNDNVNDTETKTDAKHEEPMTGDTTTEHSELPQSSEEDGSLVDDISKASKESTDAGDEVDDVVSLTLDDLEMDEAEMSTLQIDSSVASEAPDDMAVKTGTYIFFLTKLPNKSFKVDIKKRADGSGYDIERLRSGGVKVNIVADVGERNLMVRSFIHNFHFYKKNSTEANEWGGNSLKSIAASAIAVAHGATKKNALASINKDKPSDFDMLTRLAVCDEEEDIVYLKGRIEHKDASDGYPAKNELNTTQAIETGEAMLAQIKVLANG